MSIQVVSEGVTELGIGEAWRARLAVFAATVLGSSAPDRIRRVLSKLNDKRPPASAAQCARARSAVCTVSASCRGPKGCVRRSIATTLMCQFDGTSVRWCTGFSLAPFRAHAWVEADGRPVDEPDEVTDYIVMLSTTMSDAEQSGA